MALDILILSVLRGAPMHGYELKRRVQRPSLTPLSNNSLYPYLRRFEQLGAVDKTVEQQEGRPSRNVYAITPTGRRMLVDLVSTLPLELAANEEEFLMRLSFFHEVAPANRRAILAARSAVLDGGIAQVRTLIAESPTTDDRAWRNLAMTQLLERLDGERRWIAGLADRVESEPYVPAAIL